MKLRTLLLLAVVIVAALSIALLLGKPAPTPSDDARVLGGRDGTTKAGEVPTRFQPGETVAVPDADATGASPKGPTPTGGSGGVIGSRVPEGVDLSNPTEVRDELRKALALSPPDWKRVKRLLAVYDVAIESDIKTALLDGLRTPAGRMGAKEALAASRDGSLAVDLLLILDEDEAKGALRTAVLDALARMPGADANDVVLGLEARLEGEPRADALVLRAIARRGGEESVRAVIQYLERAEDPLRVPGRLALGMDLRKSPEARKVIADALAATDRADVVVALTGLAAEPGADDLVPALVGLDHEGQDEAVRRAALGALARIGTASAVEHLLKASGKPGREGEIALGELGRIASADAKAREMLMAALEDTASNPRPVEARREVLSALSNLGHPAAAPAFRDALGDPDDRVRQSAALGIGRLGRQGRPYVADLMKAYADSDRRTQRTMVLALGMVGGDEARSLLQQMRTDTSVSPEIRRAVNSALNRLPPKPEKTGKTSGDVLRGVR